MQTTTAIILVGGRGTRLGSLTDHTPKPLLPVAQRPFLLHVLDYLADHGISNVILSTGYLAQQFDETLGSSYRGVSIQYAFEESPLGTGGAIQNAMRLLKEPRAFVINGDTLFLVDLGLLETVHLKNQATISLTLREVGDVARYGHITVDGARVTKMHEKGNAGPGLINGGTYLVDREVYPSHLALSEHSFEKRTIPKAIELGQVYATLQNKYFIDIGIPEDLKKANIDLTSGLANL